jgi:hypothetical protein
VIGDTPQDVTCGQAGCLHGCGCDGALFHRRSAPCRCQRSCSRPVRHGRTTRGPGSLRPSAVSRSGARALIFSDSITPGDRLCLPTLGKPRRRRAAT